MRKFLPLLALVLVFAVGISVGYDAPKANAAGITNCYYTCDCAGSPIKCCVSLYGVVCKRVSNAPISCPQVYDC